MKLRNIARRAVRRPTELLESLESRLLPSTYYVSGSGADGNAGTSEGAALRTIQRAADLVRAGDTVDVLAGAYAGGDVIRGNTISGVDYCGILASFQDHGAALDNTVSHDNRNGIYYGNSCVDSAIRGNVITDMGKHGIMLNGDASAGGIGVMLRMDVSGNTITSTGTVAANGDGCGICALGVQDSVFADNLITRAAYGGIRLDSTDAAGPADRNTVANNTVSYARGCLNFR